MGWKAQCGFLNLTQTHTQYGVDYTEAVASTTNRNLQAITLLEQTSHFKQIVSQINTPKISAFSLLWIIKQPFLIVPRQFSSMN